MSDAYLEGTAAPLPDLVSALLYALIRNYWRIEVAGDKTTMRIFAKRLAKLGSAKSQQYLHVIFALEPEVTVEYISVARNLVRDSPIAIDLGTHVLRLATMVPLDFDRFALRASWT